MPGFSRLAGKVLLVASLFISLNSFTGDDKKGLAGGDKNFPSLLSNSSRTPVIKRISDSIYDLISLGEYGLEKDVFFNAYKGFKYLESRGELNNTDVLTICDYSQSSRNKRLYVIDVVNSRLLFNTYVSHGKNSGEEFATSFSNLNNSNKSSLGFLVTGRPYKGRSGYSLQLNGMEPGINDKVKMRSIVLHGSKYVAASVNGAKGAISRSYGCPAVPFGIHYRIINAIKGGSCVYVSYPDDWYAHTSTILNSGFDLTPSPTLKNLFLENSTATNTNNTFMPPIEVKE